MDNLSIYRKNFMYKSVVFALLALMTSMFSLQAAPAKKEPVKPLPPVKFKGKAFFPIGVYDLAPFNTPGHRRLGSIDPKLYEIGVNIAFFGNLSTPDNKMYPGYTHIVKGFERAKKDPRFKDLALIINWAEGIHCLEDQTMPGKAKRKYRPLTAQERKDREKFIAEAFSYFAKQDNVIGYSMDEPENTFTNYFRTNHPKSELNAGIGPALVEYTYWLKELIDKHHPGALQMPIIAWWGTYKDVSPIYEVLIANQYPKHPDVNNPVEFTAPLYEVNFDAARAVTAARVANKPMIYMPPSYDRLPRWSKHSFKEMRYMLFAPITRGAMGIMTWRLNRCSQEYRDNVLYPAIKELSQFKDFYLGSWHDELVSSNHDAATVDYLKKFAARDELLADVKVGKKIVVKDFVPDVSYCLRRTADNRWMLLVVNNRKEALKNVALTVDMPMPSAVKDELAGKTVKVKGKVISDDLAPFDVKVYIWSGK